MKQFIEKHAAFFNFTGWLMAVLFGLLSIYFYRTTLKVDEISYQISKTQIFDSRIATPDIVVTRGEGGPQIKSDVFASEVVFWNSGDLRADADGSKPDKPLAVTLLGQGEIVGTVVQDWNRRDLTSYSIKVADDKKSLIVEWTKFRPGFGIRLAVLHTGDGNTHIRVSADIFEFTMRDRSFEDRQEHKILFHAIGRPVTSRTLSFIPALMLLLISVPFMVWLEYRRFRRVARENPTETWMMLASRRRPIPLALIAMNVLLFVFVLFTLYTEFLSKPLPPV